MFLMSSTWMAQTFFPPQTLSVTAVLAAARRLPLPSVRVVGSPGHGRCSTMIEQETNCGMMLQQ